MHNNFRQKYRLYNPICCHCQGIKTEEVDGANPSKHTSFTKYVRKKFPLSVPSVPSSLFVFLKSKYHLNNRYLSHYSSLTHLKRSFTNLINFVPLGVKFSKFLCRLKQNSCSLPYKNSKLNVFFLHSSFVFKSSHG